MVFLWILLAGVHILPAQEVDPTGIAGRWADHPASVSVAVLDLEHDVWTHLVRADKHMVPASTLKVLTTAAAWRVLGPDHRIETTLEALGERAGDGVFQGDLVLRGGGDPTLASGRFGPRYDLDAVLDSVRSVLMKSGIRQVTGDLILDVSRFSNVAANRAWITEDVANYYAATPHGLMIDEGRTRAVFSTGATGEPARWLHLRPDEGLHRENHVTAGPRGSGDETYLFRDGDELLAVGTLPPERPAYTVRGAMIDPPSVLGGHVLSAVRDIVRGEVRVVTDPMPLGDVLMTWRSPPIREMVTAIHDHSLNLHTEHLARLLVLGPHTSAADAVRAVTDHWTDLGLGEHTELRDACGLSPMNRISARSLVRVLARMSETGWPSTLPTTLRWLPATDPPITYRVKTGSFDGVRGLIGYLEEAGRPVSAFAILFNGLSARPDPAVRREMVRLVRDLADSRHP